MTAPILYRKRLIPNECILLKDDHIISCDEERIITTWNALHPKKDLHHGRSVFFLKEGIKVSKFCHEDDSLFCWYCDIIEPEYNAETNELIVTDLLADVIIKPDGMVKVVDLEELADAQEQGLIDIRMMNLSLRRLDNLLKTIYSGEFDSLTKYLDF